MSLQVRISDLITAIGTDIKSLRALITGSGTGTTLAALTTTDKTSLIAAINEVQSEVGGGGWSPVDASETVKGIAELATQAEVNTGTDDARIVTPLKLATRITAATPDSSETVKGIVELATLAEVATGTDSLRAVTAAGVRQERTALKAEILGAGVPGALDTLDELAAALGDDANYAASVTTALSNKQPLDADLTSIAGVTSAADKFLYATGAQTWTVATVTAAARGLLDDTDVATMRGTLSVYSQAEMGNPETDLVALYTTAKA